MLQKYGFSQYKKSLNINLKRYDRRENAVCALCARRERAMSAALAETSCAP